MLNNKSFFLKIIRNEKIKIIIGIINGDDIVLAIPETWSNSSDPNDKLIKLYSSAAKKKTLAQSEIFNEANMSISLIPMLLANESILKRFKKRPGKER